MMKHIVFEGLDRVGKSTLLAAVAKSMGAEVTKMRVPKTMEQSREFYSDHFKSLLSSWEPMVWDRGHLSELVYAPLYRPQMTADWWTKVLRSMPELVPMVTVVYVYPGDTSLMKKEEDRPCADQSAERAAFDRELGLCRWPVVRVCSHELVDGVWRWRDLEERVDEVLTAVGLEQVPLRY